MPRIRSIEKIKKEIQQTIYGIQQIPNIVNRTSEITLSDVALQAVYVARKALSDTTDNTQKMASELANEVDAIIKPTEIKIIAPFHDKSMFMKKQMYFAEYGAGKLAVAGTAGQYVSKLNSEGKWVYTSSEYDGARDVTANIDEKGRPRGSRKGNYKYQRKNGTWVGHSESSRPIRYMMSAKTYAMLVLPKELSAKISGELHKIYRKRSY